MANVKFSRGEEKKYDGAGTHLNHVYFATDTKKIMMNSTDYTTDHYDPSDLTAKTIAIGGIAEGTTAESLKGKTISEMLDAILYPEYAPKYTDGSITISLTNTTPPTSGYYEVGSQFLGDVVGTATKPTAVAGNNTATSGAATITYSGTGVTPSTGFIEIQELPLGVTSFRANATFAQGTDSVKTNKGNLTQFVANNSTTLIADATDSSKTVTTLEDDKLITSVLATSAISKGTYITATYPVFTNGTFKSASTTPPSASNVGDSEISEWPDSPSSKLYYGKTAYYYVNFASKNETGVAGYIELPKGTIVTDSFVQADKIAQAWGKISFTTQEVVKTIGGKSVKYVRYTNANDTAGAMLVCISAQFHNYDPTE